MTQGLLTKEMLKGKTWQRLLPDIYIAADVYTADDHRMWCDAVALTLASGEAIDRYSAAFLWGVDLLPANAAVSVSAPRTAPAWPHQRRTIVRARLAPEDITTVFDLPVTTPLRTAFDLGRQAHRAAALIALDAICHRRLIRLIELADYAAEKSRWPGVRRLRGLLELVDARAESPMETWLRLLLHDAGAPPPTPQHVVRDANGRPIGRVDLAYRHWKIALEYEGDHHRERTQFRRDIARVNALRQAGWIVLRFTADDVLHHPQRIIDQVKNAIHERRSGREPAGGR